MASERILQRLSQFAEAATVRLQVKSALNPLLWLTGIAAPLCFGFAIFFDGALRVGLVCLGALPIICAAAAYFYWMLRAPDRLHSEDYQLRKMALELIEEKGSAIPISAASVEAITNPMVKQITSGGEDN